MSALESIERAQKVVNWKCGAMRLPEQDVQDISQDAAVDVLRYGTGNVRVHAHRVIVERLRRESGRRDVDRFEFRLFEEDGTGAWGPLDTDLVDLHMLVDRLPWRDRFIVLGRLIGFDLKEIGAGLGLSEPWVCIELQRICAGMRADLEG